MSEQLRVYQQEMLDRLYGAWGRHQSVMVQMPTGTGKTYLMAEVIRRELGRAESETSASRRPSVLVVAHRRELIEQVKDTLERFGIDSGQGTVRVESIQKLSRESQTGDSSLIDFEPSLVIVDEAHHALARTYRMLWDRWPEARFLGLTATPCRLNGTGFTDLFDELLESYDIQTFIAQGYLSDFEYVSVAPENWMLGRIRGLRKRGVDGDYQPKEMATVLDTEESIRHLYASYQQYACGKKGIVYAINRDHARHIAAYYQKHGLRCCWIESKTPAAERHSLVADYLQGRLDVIVNVDIFSEGFDCPEVEFIQLARPTLSLSKYLQQVGRGMRVTKGKECVVILDQVGLYQTFGLPTDEHPWNLMFHGMWQGRGRHGEERGFIIRNEPDAPRLVNLDMVRIKRRGEVSTGVEVFIKDGRYGILNDGKVTCAAEFEHIYRMHDGDFFAIATYPYEVFHSKSTVISLDGLDLRVTLYGKVKAHGEVFEGRTLSGQQMFWDSVGLQYNSAHPEFEEVGGVQMVRQDGKYLPRHKTIWLREAVDKKDIWYNKHILWMRNVVVFKKTGTIYPIKAYGQDCFYVDSNNLDKGLYIKVDLEGGLVYTNFYKEQWDYIFRKPNWRNAQLVRASSGKIESLSGTSL